MPPGRKPTRSREEFVAAAIALADREGLAALTLQALGSSMGASTTAVYRYFRDKDDLVVAVREALLGQILEGADLPEDPRGVILTLGRGLRHVAREHPCLAELMVRSALTGQNAGDVLVVLTGALEQLGLHDDLLVRGYRQLETFTVGSAVFDFSGAPTHLDDRGQRMAQLGHPAFAAAMPDAQGVDAVNEAAFEASLTTLLDSLIAEAAR